jgi:hypothetical protein
MDEDYDEMWRRAELPRDVAPPPVSPAPKRYIYTHTHTSTAGVGGVRIATGAPLLLLLASPLPPPPPSHTGDDEETDEEDDNDDHIQGAPSQGLEGSNPLRVCPRKFFCIYSIDSPFRKAEEPLETSTRRSHRSFDFDVPRSDVPILWFSVPSS